MGWLDVLGWAGSALLVFSLVQTRVLRFRLLNLVACIVLVIFNGALGIWPMVALNVALAGINLWFLQKLVSERHSDAAFEVLQVGPFDEYLRHTLRVHAADIEKFQPGFVWSPLTDVPHICSVISRHLPGHPSASSNARRDRASSSLRRSRSRRALSNQVW